MITGIKDDSMSQSQLLIGQIDILNISWAKSKLEFLTVTNIYKWRHDYQELLLLDVHGDCGLGLGFWSA